MKTIERVVQSSIYEYCQSLIELGGGIEKFTQMESERKNELTKTIQDLTEQIAILRKDKVRLYESYAEDMIPLDVYVAKREKADARMSSLKEEMEELKRVEAENSELITPAVARNIEDAKEIAAEIEKHEDVDEKNKEQIDKKQTEEKQNTDEEKFLTRQMVEKMVEAVYIYGDAK